ncbi:MAG: triose-phosphate isomerase, partial [Staphylothermus sp.]|nr:triose-phosphate isomerase [Staphylothermus sp.]
MVEKPIVAVNFKAYYPYSFGENALRIAHDAKKVWEETGVEIILIPPYTEIKPVLEVVKGT